MVPIAKAPTTTDSLVQEFKRTGKFDAIRRQLLEDFSASPAGQQLYQELTKAASESQLKAQSELVAYLSKHNSFRNTERTLNVEFLASTNFKNNLRNQLKQTWEEMHTVRDRGKQEQDSEQLPDNAMSLQDSNENENPNLQKWKAIPDLPDASNNMSPSPSNSPTSMRIAESPSHKIQSTETNENSAETALIQNNSNTIPKELTSLASSHDQVMVEDELETLQTGLDVKVNEDHVKVAPDDIMMEHDANEQDPENLKRKSPETTPELELENETKDGTEEKPKRKRGRPPGKQNKNKSVPAELKYPLKTVVAALVNQNDKECCFMAKVASYDTQSQV